MSDNLNQFQTNKYVPKITPGSKRKAKLNINNMKSIQMSKHHLRIHGT